MAKLLDYILHFDRYLGQFIAQHGPASTYALLFAIVFCETGLVVTPFLPGDSLLFAAGVLCHTLSEDLNVGVMFVVFCVAALLGDTVNYFIGRNFGHRLFKSDTSRVFKKSHLVSTHEFFEKHGRKTIILARFVPIVRTFCPFVAGMGAMPYRRFITFSLVGALLWVGIFLFAGYFVGGLPFVKHNFTAAVVIMLVVTAAPLAWEIVKGVREARASKAP